LSHLTTIISKLTLTNYHEINHQYILQKRLAAQFALEHHEIHHISTLAMLSIVSDVRDIMCKRIILSVAVMSLYFPEVHTDSDEKAEKLC